MTMPTLPTKTRSWWGWGTVEDAAGLEEREALAARVRGLVPGASLEFHGPPEPRSLGVARSRVEAPASLAALASTDVVDRLAHARGKAYRDVVRSLMGDVSHVPDLVVRPETEQDVVDVLDWCSREGIALIPFGGGSSVVGGVEPRFDGYPGVVTLDLERLNRVVEVDRTSRAARIQAGMFGPSLEAALRPHGLTLRHFPQSFEFSTLGGWLATRAGGHFATLYTHIDDLTESMRVVTPCGVSESRRLPSSGAGPSADRMFLGSEGALGVITEAWMRLQDRPRFRARASVHFDDYSAAVSAVRALSQSGLNPSNCRLLDAAEAFVNAGTATSGGVLALAFESADHPMDAWMARAEELARDHGGTLPRPARIEHDRVGDAEPGDAGATWKSSFLRMPYQRDVMAQYGMIAETFETACTWHAFETLHAAVLHAGNEALARVCGGGLLTCRFTHVYPDGVAPYFGVYAPGRWGSLVAQWDELKAAVSDAIVANGGTITHHHAVGRDHRPWYDRQRTEPFAAALRAAKHALDPAGILNPGVLVDARRAG
ncbi:MAG TPA: FAD-binding oxidoreductase [Polyangiaceae bacterium]|jgi:alkyldihydroxyacetonephosphate synthase|nr:FAD-binding oxidoreductase [Polyangiaceae bacterium]